MSAGAAEPGFGVAHPPKVETFDVPGGVNIDNKGFTRQVAAYRIEPFGLYMSRAIVGHRTASWLETYLLPRLGVRISKWYWKPDVEPEHERYVDIVHVERALAGEWQVKDFYLDIVFSGDDRPELVDLDEFVAAVREGLISTAEAEEALRISHAVMAGLAEHAYQLDEWLASLGITLTWHGQPT